LRLFVAIDVPKEIKDRIELDVVDRLRASVEGARWTRPEGRHLTLKFLGEVADDRLPQIADAVRAASASHRRFDAAFDELGGFPNVRRPRVLWVGIGPGAEPMSDLARDIENALESLGFETEDRPFHPHFTLARFPRPYLIDELPAANVPPTAFTVDEVVLFRSQLHPKGARYSALEAFPLAK
jgi:2'-5' RNA ligase